VNLWMVALESNLDIRTIQRDCSVELPCYQIDDDGDAEFDDDDCPDDPHDPGDEEHVHGGEDEGNFGIVGFLPQEESRWTFAVAAAAAYFAVVAAAAFVDFGNWIIVVDDCCYYSKIGDVAVAAVVAAAAVGPYDCCYCCSHCLYWNEEVRLPDCFHGGGMRVRKNSRNPHMVKRRVEMTSHALSYVFGGRRGVYKICHSREPGVMKEKSSR